MNYRGYCGAAGRPTESALYSDGLSLFEEVRKSHPNVLVVGRSLGSSVAVYVASRKAVERLVLVTPFDSLVHVGRAHFPIMPVGLLLRDRYESWKYAPQVEAPVTIIAAERDEIVPRSSTDRLRGCFRTVAEYVVIPDADHNDVSMRPGYLEALRGPQ